MMKRKGFLVLALVMMLSICSSAFVLASAEDVKPTLKYVDFPKMQDNNWTSYAWGDQSAKTTVAKELTADNSKNADKSLKVTKTVEAAAEAFASVYYQSFGSMADGLNASDMYGVRFYVYQATESSASGLGFLFGDTEQTNITCTDEGSEAILTTRDLNYTGYRRYTVPFTDGLNIEAINQLQIMIWGSQNAEVYLSNFELIYTGDLSEPTPPEVVDMGDKALMLCGFNDKSEVDLWGLAGQSGTAYKTELSGETVKEGAGSLKYSWQNQLYTFGWTESYLDVTKVVEHNKDNDLKGISFWINNTSLQTVGKVGFWVKAAEADGSEYEAHYDKVIGGTGLDFIGWKKIEIPFTAFTPDKLQSYTTDENGQFDGDQLAFIKIGIWSNGDEEIEATIYLDDLQLRSSKELSFPKENSDKDNNENNGNKGLPTIAWVFISIGAVVVIAGITVAVVIIVKKQKKSKQQ